MVRRCWRLACAVLVAMAMGCWLYPPTRLLAQQFGDQIVRHLCVGSALSTCNTVRQGSGTPQSAVSGIVGDLYLRTDGGTGTTLYVKESGTNTTTGWIGMASSSATGGVTASSSTTFTNKTIDTAGPNTIKINGNTLSASAGTATVTVPNTTETLLGTTTLCTTANWCRASVTLTDAQIKALPTTPITLVSAPGSGLMIQPLFAVLYAKTTSGAYTNINAASSLAINVSGGGPALGFVPNDAAITNGSATRLTDLLGGANNRTVHLGPYFDTEGVAQWGPIGEVVASASGTNAALDISIDNGGSGNLTGGNAANTLTAIVWYSVVTVP